MILVDSNVLMYAAGTEHPHKAPAARFLERVSAGGVEAVIDAEVLQEILHRYRALDRWNEGRRVYDLARAIFPLAIPVTAEVMDRARRLLDQHNGLGARDAVHAAVVETHALASLCSFDRDFDRIPGLRRIEPT
ncbi:MAG: type II toxin-antitoxin system VapC family toxin [Longimicrobiales bacterium]